MTTCQYAVTEADLYSLPTGTVLYKPQLNGWTLFLRDHGIWLVIDAYDRDRRGERYTPGAVGCFTPGYVVHQAPAIGYYNPAEAGAGC